MSHSVIHRHLPYVRAVCYILINDFSKLNLTEYIYNIQQKVKVNTHKQNTTSVPC